MSDDASINVMDTLKPFNILMFHYKSKSEINNGILWSLEYTINECLPLAVFSMARHRLFKEHKAVINTAAKQWTEAGCFPEDKTKNSNMIDQLFPNQNFGNFYSSSSRYYVMC